MIYSPENNVQQISDTFQKENFHFERSMLRILISTLQKDVDFFVEQRQKIFEKYGDAQKDGTFTFTDTNEEKASAELETLLDMEVTPEFEALEIPVTENLRLSVHDIDALTPFIHFTE